MNPEARHHLLTCRVDPEDVAFLASGAMTHQPATSAVARFRADPEARFLVLSGGPGCGKTIAGAGWLLSARRYTVDDAGIPHATRDTSARLVKAASLGLLNLRFNERDRAELEALKAVHWLVLDDLGLESDDAVGVLRDLIDHRYGHPVRTVITTMLAVQPGAGEGGRSRFEARYGPATVGRITHRGWLAPCGTQNLRTRHPTPEARP